MGHETTHSRPSSSIEVADPPAEALVRLARAWEAGEIARVPYLRAAEPHLRELAARPVVPIEILKAYRVVTRALAGEAPEPTRRGELK